MTVFEELVELLKSKNYRISAAESCTGGMFISSVVDVPDASKILGASFITYSDDAKIKLVGVNKETIEKFSVVSENVAIEMAKGAAIKSEAQIGVGITGYAGPAADENDTDAGTVCFGFYFDGKTLSVTKKFGNAERNIVRELSCVFACNTLIKLIGKFGD